MYRKDKTEKDVRYILEHLRDADRHECIIQRGDNYIDELTEEIMKDDNYFVLGAKKSDGTPVCMGGCSNTNEKGVGIVWFLSTPEVVKYQFCLLKNIKRDIEMLTEDYYMLFNFIYKENFLAKRWLSKFGFSFEQPKGLKIPEDFEMFYKVRKTRRLK